MALDIKQLQQHRVAKRPITQDKKPGFGRINDLIKKDIKLFKGFSNKQKERFFSEVGLLLSSGVDLQTVLTLSSQSAKNALNEVYVNVLEQITAGKSLASAMEYTTQFNNFDCYSVLIGENTGELARVFEKLSIYYSKRIAQRRKINGSLSYPIIVLITTIGAIYFMLKFVVPMFSETLVRFGGELPPLTKFIITLSHNISTYFLVATGVITILVVLYRRNRHKERVKAFTSGLMLKLPYIGKVIYKTHMVQFTQAMDLLLNSKVNIVESIELTQKMLKFYPLTKALHSVTEGLMRGEFFYKCMEEQRLFEPTMITLVKIGEEVNQLDKIFMQLSKQYESDLEYQSSIMITILEPITILVLAFLVSVILIAMYLPMFKIGSVVH